MLVNARSRTFSLLTLLALMSALLVGCGGQPAAVEPSPAVVPTEAPAEEAVSLTVFAAASLTDAFNDIATAFSAANPGVTPVFNFAGSNQLATQIGEGAPADVLASANRRQMDVAVESGRVAAGAPQVFVTNRLVVVVPADNPAGIEALTDLAAPDTLLVLAAEEVPAGQYALEFLDKAAADTAFAPGFKDAVLANVVSYEENVRAVLNKVALGEADAGIVYASDAVTEPGVAAIDIPDALNVLAEYPIAPLNDSAQPAAAAAFVELVLSAEGQAILAEYGFGPAVRE